MKQLFQWLREGSKWVILRNFGITIYGFPWRATWAMIVGTLDPMATLLNANGDVVSAMLIKNF
jgi:hypothetical protein